MQATDPWAGRLRTIAEKQQLTMTSYADDVGETHVARRGESMLEIARAESQSFEDAIGMDGLKDIAGQAEHSVRTAGKGR